MTPISRRLFLHSTAAASAAALAPTISSSASPQLPSNFSNLKPLGDRRRTLNTSDFHDRLLHAQNRMSEIKPALDALVIGPGSSLYYFTGIRWGLSERLLALVLPRSGEPILICPAFEESRMRESLRFPLDVHLWQEDESPTQLIVSALAAGKIRSGRIAIEETLPFTFYDHLRAAAASFTFPSADTVTVPLRSRKSAQELEFMRLACEATCIAYREVFVYSKEGMTQEEIAALISAGYSKMNLRGYALVLIGASAALPHGSRQPQKLKQGDVILID